MTNWFKCANNEISKTPRLRTIIIAVRSDENLEASSQNTAITDKRTLTAVMAVPNQAKSIISMLSNGSASVLFSDKIQLYCQLQDRCRGYDNFELLSEEQSIRIRKTIS